MKRKNPKSMKEENTGEELCDLSRPSVLLRCQKRDPWRKNGQGGGPKLKTSGFQNTPKKMKRKNHRLGKKMFVESVSDLEDLNLDYI